MPTFTSAESINNYLSKNVKFILQKQIANVVEKIIKDYIMENLYNAYKPTDYVRTYEFINSLTVNKVEEIDKGKYEVKLFFDTSKIHPNIVEDRFWNQHADVYGNDVSEYIPTWIEYGTSGSLWDRDGLNVMNFTKEELESTGRHLNILRNLLKEKGFILV